MAASAANPPSNPPASSTTPSDNQQQRIRESYASFVHNAALGGLIVAPILIAIPPRKLDLYTFFLTGAFVASANQITKERTGAGLLSQFTMTKLPPRAQEFQERMKAEKEQRRLLEEPVPAEVIRRGNPAGLGKLEEKAREIWMGGETEGWKERRLKEEQEKIAQGEGYGSMIVDQIWDVWTWGEKKGEEIKKKDKEVLASREKANEFPKIGKD